MSHHRAVVRLPPVALEKASDDAIAAAPVPDECAAWGKHACELIDDASVVGGLNEEAERREEIQDRAEATRPPCRQAPHVSARITESRAGTAGTCSLQQRGGVVHTVDVEARLGEQVRMASLSAWTIENSRAGRQAEDRDESRYLASIPLEREERLVLEQILGVEVRRPPITGLPPAARRSTLQKNTGSR